MLKSFLLKFSALLLTVLFNVGLVTAEGKNTYVPEPLDPAVEDFILRSTGLIHTEGDTQIARPKLIPEPLANEALRNFWIGSQSLTEAKGEIKMRLESEGKGLKPFYLSVIFGETHLLIKHNAPKSDEFSGGFRLPVDDRRAHKFMLEGSGRRTVIAVVPPKINPQLRGVALCFRDASADASPYEAPLLLNTDYRIKEIEFLPEVWARGAFNSGVVEGYARAEIKVGQAAGETRPTDDEAKSLSPSVSVGYAPKSNPLGYGIQMDPSGALSTGAFSMVELKTIGGQKRIKTHRADYFIKRLNNISPANVTFANIVHPVDSGSCELIVQRRYLLDEMTGSARSIKDEIMQNHQQSGK
jgi:hypothetical protein